MKTTTSFNRAYSCPLMLGLLLHLLLSISCCNAAYILTVSAKDEECFNLFSPKFSGTFFGNYDLLDDSSRSAEAVSLVVMDAANHRILYRSRRGSNEGNFKIEVASGQRLNVCVQNGIFTAGRRKTVHKRSHDNEDRTVGLQFSFEEKDPGMELHNQNGRLVSATRGLIRELGRLQDHYGYMRAREAMHREVVEGTFTKLMSWTLFQGGTVILVAVAQIMYFRRFLERRRYI